MKRFLIMILLCCSMLLSGCSWMDGSSVSVQPHKMPQQTIQDGVSVAEDYLDLMEALERFISGRTENAVIAIPEYPADSVDSGMGIAIRYVKENYPLGAYAVEDISYEYGTSGGQPALALTIAYRHSLSEMLQIRRVEDVAAAQKTVSGALDGFSAGIVLYIKDYDSVDFTQYVQDYAWSNPQMIMETPQVSEVTYGTGDSRVVELSFTYQNSRDSLRQMKIQVKPVFEAASLYISGDGEDRQKLSQLYAFLVERFDYIIETSITPAYSLLRHGVGDSRAFATVYAAMCRGAGLECMTVTGTCSGEPRTWNIVLDDGHYYHVDLLRSNELGFFREYTDSQMYGYVWDYSAYPACTGEVVPEESMDAAAPEETLPDQTEETIQK